MTFHLFFAIPEQVVLNEDILSVIVPGSVGSFEVLKGHAAIISALTAGRVEILDTHKKKWFWNISGGYFEMSNNQATLLADSVELG